MSIRLKVLFACLGFLAISVSAGMFERYQDAKLGALTMDVYDKALIGVKYAQKVQIDFTRLKASGNHTILLTAYENAQLQALLEDLDIAIDRAISAKGKAAAIAVRAKLSDLPEQVSQRNLGVWEEIDSDLDHLVQQYTADGFTYRIRAEDLIDASDRWVVGVISISILLTIAITLLLIRAIVPPLQRATSVALAIAGGRLDNEINPRGRDETALLLRSLATMQGSIRSARDELEAANRSINAANLDLQARLVELREAQDELMRKERLSALGQLTATMAHEIRNPLSAIRNSFYSIKELVVGSGLKLERPIERVERSIARCDRIINDMLDFTRVRDLRCTAVEADKWIEEILNDQRLPDGVTLVRMLNAPGSVLNVDTERMRRVINNLVENAAQAIAGVAGGLPERTITVGTCASSGAIEITVADTGPGIAADVMPKIFEPLFTTKSFGTGLGLPMVKQIVEQHGGTVEITSKPNQGTRVVLTIPQANSKEIAA
jgi:signal transduction histidine kinase